MPQFNVQLRAIRHLTADVTVEAETREEAERKALEARRDVPWDESEPEDERVESVILLRQGG